MILVATGGVDHDHVVALANKYFTRNDKYIGPGTPTFERDVPKLDNDIYANFWKETEFQSCEIRQSYNQGKNALLLSILKLNTYLQAIVQCPVVLYFLRMVGAILIQ